MIRKAVDLSWPLRAMRCCASPAIHQPTIHTSAHDLVVLNRRSSLLRPLFRLTRMSKGADQNYLKLGAHQHLGKLLHLPRLWAHRVRQREVLLNLDDDQMRDGGLDPVLVHREAAKPFWRDIGPLRIGSDSLFDDRVHVPSLVGPGLQGQFSQESRSTRKRPFFLLQAFALSPFRGDPVAVIGDADDLTSEEMQILAKWTGLKETAFLLRSRADAADYRARIFGPDREFRFASQATLGSCYAWLALGNISKGRLVLQECDAGVIKIKQEGSHFAFEAPPLKRYEQVSMSLIPKIGDALGIDRRSIKGAQWVDNGPGWLAVLLGSRQEVLDIKRNPNSLENHRLGVVGPWDKRRDGNEAQFEVRAFGSSEDVEEPATGCLNAGLATWLISTGVAEERYVASQGTALGRPSRIHVVEEGRSTWIGGHINPSVAGTIVV